MVVRKDLFEEVPLKTDLNDETVYHAQIQGKNRPAPSTGSADIRALSSEATLCRCGWNRARKKVVGDRMS